jgi:FdhD protein
MAMAVTYNGGTYAVMMATPEDLEDFAIGFSLNEKVVESADEVQSIDIIEVADGIEVRLWLLNERAEHLAARRRHMAGPTGCGLCGIESLAEALRSPAVVRKNLQYSYRQVLGAMDQMPLLQRLNSETRAVHAAAFWTSEDGIVLLREDVGRHNALDKLAGALSQVGISGDAGMVLLTSRVSVEMVQKAGTIGTPVLVSVSAPTALAVRVADKAGITLIAVARHDGFEVFTHADRIVMLG